MEQPLQSGLNLPPGSGEHKHDRLALWLQFPRRLLFLLFAGGLAYLGISLMRTAMPFNQVNSPAMDEIWARAQNSFRLLMIAFAISLVLSMITMIIAYFIQRLETRSAFWGSLLKAFGRLWIFSDISLPAFALGILFIWIFALTLRWLPAAGMFSPSGDNPGDRLRHMILPVLALVFMPAGLAAQGAARRMINSSRKGFLRWAAGILRLLAALFRQMGGILGAIAMVEFVFAWPGIGRMAVETLMYMQFPNLFSVAAIFIGLIFVGRLFAELFECLALIADQNAVPLPEPDTNLKKARKAWLIFTLVLLAVLIAFTVYGGLMGAETVDQVNPEMRNTGPSAGHWLGTDALGRDLWARIAKGSAVTFGVAALSAIPVTLIAYPLGLLAGWLSRKRKWWSDLLSDLVLLPSDAGLFIPVVVLGMMLYFTTAKVMGPGSIFGAVLIIVLTILPRMIRFMAQLWMDAREGKAGKRAALSALSLLLGGVFTAFGAMTCFSYLGLVLEPRTASLGGVIRELLMYMNIGGLEKFLVVLVLWIYLWVLYLAADVFLEDWTSKSAFSWLNT